MARRLPAPPDLHRGNPVRFLGSPQPGFFKLRLRRHGPWVPAIVWRPVPYNRQHELLAMIGDRDASPHEVWERGVRITPAVYAYLVDLLLYAREHDPDAPEAHPADPINLAEIGTLF